MPALPVLLLLAGVDVGCLFQGLLGKLLSDAGSVGHFVVTVDGLDVLVHSKVSHVLLDGALVDFVDQEVGDDRLYLQGSRGSDRTAADVQLYRRVVDVGHVADLLGLGYAAADRKIRLDDLKHVLLQEFAEAPAGVDSLAARKRNVRKRLVDLKHVVHVERVAGLFVVEDVEGLKLLAELDAGVHVRIRVGLDYDVEVGSAGFAHGFGALVAGIEHLLAQLAAHLPVGVVGFACPLAFVGDSHGVYLYGVVAVLKGVFSGLCVVSRVGEEKVDRTPAELQLACVCPDPVVGLAAQELVDGHLVCLAYDVPQRGVDGAHTGVDDGAAAHAPEGGAEDGLPDSFRLKGIHSYDELAVIPGDAYGSVMSHSVGEADFAVAVDVLAVGIDANADDFAHDVGLAFDDVNTCDLHN